MKNVGLVLLVVGIGCAATFGARNPASIHESNIAQGAATFDRGLADEAHSAYCDALGEAAEARAAADACGDPPEGGEHPEVNYFPEAAELAALSESERSLREEWVRAHERATAAEAAVGIVAPASPGDRLNDWFSLSGLPFLLGLVLVVVGAVLARKASGADDTGTTDAEGRPVDFGELLGTLVSDVRALSAEARGVVDPKTADFDRLRQRVHELQADKVERLIGARKAVERRHGLATYAAIFSPFSGGERALNRAWATLADQHWPESMASLEKAEALFAAAQAEIPGARG